MKILNEDKVIKLGGKVDPKFGWCIIVVGGPGSGKSTAFKHKILAQTRKYDPDELKLFKYHDSDFDGEYFVLKSGQKFYPAQYGIDPPYDLTNMKVTAALHELTRPIRNSLKAQMLSDKTHNAQERLPNISFDITGSDVEDITSIVDTAKEIGYKICIVWVVTEVKVAFNRRVNDPKRRVDPEVVIKKHAGVHNTLNTLLVNNVVESVDDFWILLDTVSVENLNSEKYDDVVVSNVFKVNSTKELSGFDDIIAQELESNPRLAKYLDAYYNIYKKSRDEITDYYKTNGLGDPFMEEKLEEAYGISGHYSNEREERERIIRDEIGYGKPIRRVLWDRGHINGPEIHEVSDTGIITIYNQRTGIVVTRLIARPGQIRRYYTNGSVPPQQVLDLAREHQKSFYNYM